MYESTNLMGDLKTSRSEINNCSIQLLDPDLRVQNIYVKAKCGKLKIVSLLILGQTMRLWKQ